MHLQALIKCDKYLQAWQRQYIFQVELIKRANRLYTNDSIFLKKSLSIPVLSDLNDHSNGVDSSEEDHKQGKTNCDTEDYRKPASDLTPGDLLKRLDNLISQSKEAAVRGCKDAEKRYFWLPCLYTITVLKWHHLLKTNFILMVISSKRHISIHIP